ncbi:hypothetical protein BBOV_III011670 [Babesia bovis T2Bo]|uniref:NFACT RNA-binding domain-containing protein n=1 Tax=Babesia bovis TaxID=5865 RepID=A7AQ85_BABBO|nr:hypothetical protein BBOV_III011670 [Babesia bovis T2Bo]EDO08719.1 hypothetical protein BBOV_III011670 [Babesia bovis T2Bo]|eukprot:XP_001612287.1 domain of unknown function (DUF814) containing protein [Babesia bovis T2Bo]
MDKYPLSIRKCSKDDCISAFDKIKNDELILPQSIGDRDTGKKHMSFDFMMLRQYANELDHVFSNATFMGITHIPTKQPHVEHQTLDSALFHFRGFERGESLCLYHSSDGFPLVPSPSATYIPSSERLFTHLERVMSGLTGLRVTRIHCPYFFKNIIAVELKPPHHELGQNFDTRANESYRIMFIAHRGQNRMVTIDNNDGVILLTSGAYDEKSGIKDGVGSVFKIKNSGKVTPDPAEPFDNFMERFKSKEHMSLVKAMVLTFEGIGAQRVTLLAEKAGINCTKHVSKIENIVDFYNCYIRWLRSPDGFMDTRNFKSNIEMFNASGTVSNVTTTVNTIDDIPSPGAAELQDEPKGPITLIEYVFSHWGYDVPVYIHNRLAEEARMLIDKTLERLGAIREQCIGDEQQVERLAKVQQRINSIMEYSRSLEGVMKWKLPDHFELVKTIYQQVGDLGDLTGYRRKLRARRKKEIEGLSDDELELRNVPHAKPKEPNLFKGILVIKINPGDPQTPIIIIGRNAAQNERVTHEIARSGDIWFHTKDCPGSHVLLRRYGGSKDAIQIAADIATYYSKAKKMEHAPVIKTGIDNVTKCPDAKIGAVIVSHYDTLEGYPTRGGEYVKAHRISMK